MSLETASYINDLVSTNPEGTDPKSQGDDHIRMIKQVLKTQFSGFTEDVALNVLASNLNNLGGTTGDDGAVNFDLVTHPNRFIGVGSGSTGTFPPGSTAAAGIGDAILNIAVNTGRAFQLYFHIYEVWARAFYASAWSVWVRLDGLGAGQSWQSFLGSRAVNTVYTNNSNRIMQVSAIFAGSGAAQTLVQGQVNGGTIQTEYTNSNNGGGSFLGRQATIQLVVPVGGTYQMIATGSNAIQQWWEFR